MKLNVAQRMEEFQPGIFNVLDERRQQRLAQGLPVYNLSIGTPDFLPDPHVVQALAQAASQPANYRYSLTELPELVEAVQHWYLRRYGVELEPEELMSIYGSQEGLTHIGVRAHYIRPVEGPGPNALPCRVERVVENVFSTVVMLSTPGGSQGFSRLRIELEKDRWAALSQRDPLWLELPSKDLLLLTSK